MSDEGSGLRGRKWRPAYRTSAFRPDGRVDDILNDFYIPALERSVLYRRMAGYFTSSSLAAASRGFASFTASDGRMRLITGADLDSEDVEAVLAGEEERLSCLLEERLEDLSWPEDVRRGVELLGWMVARGVLEVRVAIRVHSVTGEGLPFDSNEDGYVHEKWAVFEDDAGDILLAGGSLNESRSALVLNAENIAVDAGWWGKPSSERAEEHKRDFDLLWENGSPHLRVYTLPEAVRERLVQLGESAHPRTASSRVASGVGGVAPSFREWLSFRVLQLAPQMPGGLWLGMESAPVAPWPHQRMVARRLVESYPKGFLLCDEVGLGKTIEAGLAFRSLLLSGVVRRILIAPPAGLGRQWLREMAEKFFLPFRLVVSSQPARHEALFPESATDRSEGLLSPDLCIVSTGLLVRKERHEEIGRAESFDIVLVDEAHAARRSNSSAEDGCRVNPDYNNLYEAISKLLVGKARSLWLATATPVQLDWVEAHDLLRLLRRTGAFDKSPSLTRSYYDLLGRVADGGGLEDDDWIFLRNVVTRVQCENPMYWEVLGDGLIHGRLRRRMEDWCERGRTPRPSEVGPLLFAIAPLSRVMLRHSRKLLGIYQEKGELRAGLATRNLMPPPMIGFSAGEREVYDDLQLYCAELKDLLGERGEGAERASLGFYLSFLRQRFASSLFALAESLRRRREKVEATLAHGAALPDYEAEEQDDDVELFPDGDALEGFLENRGQEDLEWERGRLAGMIARLDGMTGIPSKIRALLSELEKRRERERLRQTVLFTRYMDTLEDIRAHLRLREPTLRTGVYSGKKCSFYDAEADEEKRTGREEVKRLFLRGEIDLLLCTDAAAEGLNLQTADMIINFDLPWNPMKVEQRIGRIDRIGQRHDTVHVLNMCVLGSVEEAIYDRLLKRLYGAMDLVGSLDFSLLPVQPDEFESYASRELSEGELERRALERLENQRRRVAGMEMSPGDQYDFYSRIREGMDKEVRPATLEGAWKVLLQSEYLKALGCARVAGHGDSVLMVRGVPGVEDGVCLTADRDLYERGIDGGEAELHFASWGDMVFDTLLSHVIAARPGEERVREVSCVMPHRTVRALAASVAEGAILVSGLDDVDGVRGDIRAPSEETEALERELRVRAEAAEGGVLSARGGVVDRIMRISGDAARSEHLLELLLSHSMLNSSLLFDSEGERSFRSVIERLEKSCEERGGLHVRGVPTQTLRSALEETLWDFRVPLSGSVTSLDVPAILSRALLDVACREADALKKGRGDTTLDMVKDRLSRRIREALK